MALASGLTCADGLRNGPDSLTRNHALIDGNKRLALGALIVFYGLNGRRLTLTNDAAYDLVTAVASGTLDDVNDIAGILAHATTTWP
jgi:death-on-curing protein